MSDSQIKYLCEKIHVHRWPRDGPEWDDTVQKEIDESLNKNPAKKQVTIKDNIIQIENFQIHFTQKDWNYSSLSSKKNAPLIFEAQFGNPYLPMSMLL